MTTPVLSVVASSKSYPPDWLRLVAIWSWMHARPTATFQELLEALPLIDSFVEMGARK